MCFTEFRGYHCLRISLLLLIAFVVGCQSNSGQTVLKLGHVANESDIWHKSCLFFAKEVETRTEGRLKVQVFPAEQLGKELEMIRSIKEGIMDMTISGESMQNWTPHAALCGIPYLIDDWNQVETVINSSEGQTIADEIKSKVGLVPVAYFVRGGQAPDLQSSD